MKSKINVISVIAFSLISANFYGVKAAAAPIKNPSIFKSRIFLEQTGKNLKTSDALSKKEIEFNKKVNIEKENSEKNKKQSKIFEKTKKQKLKKIFWISAGILAAGAVSLITCFFFKRNYFSVLAGASKLPLSGSKEISDVEKSYEVVTPSKINLKEIEEKIKTDEIKINSQNDPIEKEENKTNISLISKEEINQKTENVNTTAQYNKDFTEIVASSNHTNDTIIISKDEVIVNNNQITDDGALLSSQVWESSFPDKISDDEMNEFEKKMLEKIQKKDKLFSDIVDLQKRKSVILDEVLMEDTKEDKSALNKKNLNTQESKKSQPRSFIVSKINDENNLKKDEPVQVEGKKLNNENTKMGKKEEQIPKKRSKSITNEKISSSYALYETKKNQKEEENKTNVRQTETVESLNVLISDQNKTKSLKMPTSLENSNLTDPKNETIANGSDKNAIKSSNSFFSKIFRRQKNTNEQNPSQMLSKQDKKELDNYLRERREKTRELNYLRRRGTNKKRAYQLEAQLQGVAYAI